MQYFKTFLLSIHKYTKSLKTYQFHFNSFYIFMISFLKDFLQIIINKQLLGVISIIYLIASETEILNIS